MQCSLQIEVVLLQIWEVVYGKDNQVKEVTKVMQLKGHKVSLRPNPELISIHLRIFQSELNPCLSVEFGLLLLRVRYGNLR